MSIKNISKNKITNRRINNSHNYTTKNNINKQYKIITNTTK